MGRKSPRGSLDRAARCSTASKPSRSETSTSRTSLRIVATLGILPPGANVQRSKRSLSKPTTSCPPLSSVGVRTVPIYPRCPVTSRRIRSLFPNGPRALARFPEPFQIVLVAQRVHGRPKAVVSVSHELAVPRKFLQGRVLEHFHVAVDIVEHLRFQHEERPVDPTLGSLGLLLEGYHLIALEAHVAVTRRWTHGGDCG